MCRVLAEACRLRGSKLSMMELSPFTTLFHLADGIGQADNHYTSFNMARITERIRLALRLVKRIEAEAKLQKTSVITCVRTAIERYLDELAKQKIAANTAGKPKDVSLILETPVALWTQTEKEFADEVIQRHFDEDR